MRTNCLNREGLLCRSVIKGFQDKQTARMQQLEEYRTKVAALRDQLQKLALLLAQLPQKRMDLMDATERAEARLSTRNERPSGECKTDDAEATILKEIEDLQRMQEQLKHHQEKMEQADSKMKMELQLAEDLFTKCQKARDIDVECVKKEYQESELYPTRLRPSTAGRPVAVRGAVRTLDLMDWSFDGLE